MKKIDFHIHTIPTDVEPHFEYDISWLKSYVKDLDIDAIAITNHNTFDKSQFINIKNALDIKVFPGIEINLGDGHALLISEDEELDDFDRKCTKVDGLINSANEFLSVPELEEIYIELSKYLIIPHYYKKPSLSQGHLDKLRTNCIAGEVASPKKFMYTLKNEDSLTPVLFSDSRVSLEQGYLARQTYIEVPNLNLSTIKSCLFDKSKVALTDNESKKLIQVTPEKINISSGLTILLGGRSSGKTVTLNNIYKFNENVKYVKQFQLIEPDPEKAAKQFKENIGKKQQEQSDKYLRRFSDVVDEIRNISIEDDETNIDEYVKSLIKNANEEKLEDEHSKTKMFSENEFDLGDTKKTRQAY